jgi:hypothetical protein
MKRPEPGRCGHVEQPLFRNRRRPRQRYPAPHRLFHQLSSISSISPH